MSRSAVNKAAPEGVEANADADARPSRRVRRGLIVAVAGVLVIVVTAVVADFAASAGGEYRFSRSLQSSPRVRFDPEVTLRGFPYVRHAADGSFPGAVITARGVSVAGCDIHGGCTAELGATLGPFEVADGWSIGATDELRTASLQAYTRLDSVNLGRFLGILDLTVNTPAPTGKAGAGGPQDGLLRRSSGVLLTGTVPLPPTPARPVTGYPTPADTPSAAAYPGATAKVSVDVDLSVRDGRLHLEATGFYTGPEEHVTDPTVSGGDDALRTAVLRRFSITLPPIPLPWGVAPTGAHSEGSDVLLVADTGPRTLRPDSF